MPHAKALTPISLVRRYSQRVSRIALTLSVTLMVAGPAMAQTVTGLVWRNVGPFRAGRVSAVSGAVGEPGVAYAGYPAGGLWKTSNAGATWEPIFDSVTSVSSIGSVAVAPSDTNVVYVGTGDVFGGASEGDGVYKSTDAGRTWRHLGLDSTTQIPSILVDPRDPDLVMIAAQGDPRTLGGQRGVYRSTDGGRNWTRTLYVDDQIGVMKLASAADRPDVVFATTDRHYNPPVPQRGPPNGPSGTSVYKSTDRGVTWHEVTGGGLPRLEGRTSIAVAMHTNAQRVFFIGNFGLWRSDDGGATWRQMDADDRRIGNGQGGYNCGVYVSPANPDVVITVNTSSYISTDGGSTFTGFKGAPGGDDPQQLWIDPTDPQRMVMGVDQGAIVTLDGGRTWSSWYNQSTEQVYHISVDSSFPYWIYAPQQDAGAIRTRSRGNYGAVTPMDWSPVGTWEWGTLVADPRDPNVVYGSGSGIQRLVYPSEQIINVSPAQDPKLTLRIGFAQPLIWAPWDLRMLLAGFQSVMATTDGGAHWRALSPDLGFPKGVSPPPDSMLGRPGTPRGGAIETLAASTVRRGVIWAGTSNGLIKLTRDEGRTWEDVTIPDLPDSNRSGIVMIEASHHDPATAWVAARADIPGDFSPRFYRTHDFGASWTRIITGLPTGRPSGGLAQLIREDTRRAGLLFAGTASGIFVSFDDGDHWQSLQLNMPTTDFRDALVVGNDFVVGTYGRGIWILDDISPLRQLTAEVAAEPVHLFAPGTAVRVHRNVNGDTPFPPEVPHALNPVEGVAIYYGLAARPAGEITLDVLDASGAAVRHLSSTAPAPVSEAARPPHPNFWVAAPEALPTAPGINRAHWDLRYDPPPALTHSYEINANPYLTPASPEGPLARPGVYTVRLTVNGTAYTSTVSVVPDPRARASAAAIAAQSDLQLRITRGLRVSYDGARQATALQSALAADTAASVPSDISAAVKTFLAKVDSVAGGGAPQRGFRRGGATPQTFTAINGTLTGMLNGQDLADMAPTEAALAGYQASCEQLKTAVTRWNTVRDADLAAVNAARSAHGMAAVAAPGQALEAPACAAPAPARAPARRVGRR
jgi:photosystem II stability/assembly factor-like uncharacterized protein